MNEPVSQGMVSTIIPVFNRPGLVVRAVQSVMDQTHRPIEILVVDDGSTDDTPRVVDNLAWRLPEEIRVIHKENGGPGLAREAGRVVARGEFIQYLDSDDILLPRKFRLQVQALRDHPECGVGYGPTGTIGEDGQHDLTPRKRTGELVEAMFPAFLADRWWDTSTPLYRATVLQKAGPWTALRSEEDWEYDCRVAALGTRLAFVAEPGSMTTLGALGSLCRQSMTETALQHRTQARLAIGQHARRAGIPEAEPDVQRFANAVFLLARQCGAAGLSTQAGLLMGLVRRICPNTVAASGKYRAYSVLGRLLGWSLAGRLAVLRDRLRGSPA